MNIPLPPETDDELFIYAFTEIVPELVVAFNPDLVVSQLGVDTFQSDPLAHLNITTIGFCRAVRMIRAFAPKWVALGGGGYDMANVARAWTLAWAIMNDADAPDEIPEAFLRQYPDAGFQSRDLRDQPFVMEEKGKERMKAEVDRVIGYIKKNLLKRI